MEKKNETPLETEFRLLKDYSETLYIALYLNCERAFRAMRETRDMFCREQGLEHYRDTKYQKLKELFEGIEADMDEINGIINRYAFLSADLTLDDMDNAF